MMIHQKAEYEIKSGKKDGVKEAMHAFVTAVRASEPRTDYKAYRVNDSNNIIHLMTFCDDVSQERHRKAEYTLKFMEALFPTCSEPPEFIHLGIFE